MTALRPIVGSIIRAIAFSARLGAGRTFAQVMKSTAPVSRTAAPTTNSTAIVIMPSFDSPASAWSTPITPRQQQHHDEPIRMMSGVSRLKISSAKTSAHHAEREMSRRHGTVCPGECEQFHEASEQGRRQVTR